MPNKLRVVSCISAPLISPAQCYVIYNETTWCYLTNAALMRLTIHWLYMYIDYSMYFYIWQFTSPLVQLSIIRYITSVQFLTTHSLAASVSSCHWFQVIGARAAQRYGGKMILFLAVFLWSFSTFITPLFGHSRTSLILLRVILGLGEGLGRNLYIVLYGLFLCFRSWKFYWCF